MLICAEQVINYYYYHYYDQIKKKSLLLGLGKVQGNRKFYDYTGAVEC